MLGLILQPTLNAVWPAPPKEAEAEAPRSFGSPPGAGHSRAPSTPPPPLDSGSSFILQPSSFPLALSPQDQRRLETLSDPTLSPLQLAAWLTQPHIQHALEALNHLRAAQDQLWRDQVTREAIDTLREVSKTTDDPAERRRAASTILRALNRSHRPQQSRGPEHAEPRSPAAPTPHSSSCSFPAQASGLKTQDSGLTPQDSGLKTQDPAPTHPSSFSLHPSNPPGPLSDAAHASPDALTNEIVARLRALDNPNPESVRDAIWDALHIMVWGDPKRALDLGARIAAGPLCDPALRATVPTVEHIETTESTATRRLRWPDTALLLHLEYDDGNKGRFFPRHWVLADITPDTG